MLGIDCWIIVNVILEIGCIFDGLLLMATYLIFKRFLFLFIYLANHFIRFRIIIFVDCLCKWIIVLIVLRKEIVFFTFFKFLSISSHAISHLISK